MAGEVGRPSTTSSHSARFVAAHVGLVTLAFAVVGVTYYVAQRPAPPPPPPFSVWHPSARALQAQIKQIATFVGGRYRLSSGRPLVQVAAGPLEADAHTMSGILLVVDPNATPQLYATTSPKDTVLYALCGSGKNCALGGTPSESRGDLLRREAIELALYTFKYAKDSATVVVTLPLAPRTQQGSGPFAILFKRSDLQDELKQPVAKTLVKSVPPPPEKIGPRDRTAIRSLTSDKVFTYQFGKLKNGQYVMAVVPVKA